MLQVDMTASLRKTSKKGFMRRLREDGMTPAVVYGGGSEAIKLQLETKELMSKLLKFYRKNTIVTLNIEGEGEKNVVISEVQTDPVKDTLVHVDFCELALDKDREFQVPVYYEGTAKGVDLGGVLNVLQDTVIIKGKPLDIPDSFEIDVTDLDIGESIKCGTINIPDNVSLITAADAAAVSVIIAGSKTDEDEVEEEIAEEEGATPEEEPEQQ